MKFGIRIPSLKRRLAARTSLKRYVRHSMGLKAPRGMGMLTNPKRALYNKVYNKTTIGVDDLIRSPRTQKPKTDPLHGKRMTITTSPDGTINCPRCGTNMGQPITKGLFMKQKVFVCPSCKLEAKIAK